MRRATTVAEENMLDQRAKFRDCQAARFSVKLSKRAPVQTLPPVIEDAAVAPSGFDPDCIHDNIHNVDHTQHAAIKETEARDEVCRRGGVPEVAGVRNVSFEPEPEPEPEPEHRREIDKVCLKK